MNLYIDLDETLIHSIVNPSPKRTKVELSNGEKFYTFLRPKALDMLKDLRNISSGVKILTSATREYAYAMNDIFGLEFIRDHIYAREDCWVEECIPYYGRDLLATKTSFDTKGILIDNLFVTEIWSRRKMHFLGILPDRYIQIRECLGRKDPEKFDMEWQEIINKIKILTAI